MRDSYMMNGALYCNVQHSTPAACRWTPLERRKDQNGVLNSVTEYLVVTVLRVSTLETRVLL